MNTPNVLHDVQNQTEQFDQFFAETIKQHSIGEVAQIIEQHCNEVREIITSAAQKVDPNISINKFIDEVMANETLFKLCKTKCLAIFQTRYPQHDESSLNIQEMQNHTDIIVPAAQCKSMLIETKKLLTILLQASSEDSSQEQEVA